MLMTFVINGEKIIFDVNSPLNTDMALNVDELPGNFHIEGCSLNVILLENETSILNTTDQMNFLKISFQMKTNTGTWCNIFY